MEEFSRHTSSKLQEQLTQNIELLDYEILEIGKQLRKIENTLNDGYLKKINLSKEKRDNLFELQLKLEIKYESLYQKKVNLVMQKTSLVDNKN